MLFHYIRSLMPLWHFLCPGRQRKQSALLAAEASFAAGRCNVLSFIYGQYAKNPLIINLLNIISDTRKSLVKGKPEDYNLLLDNAFPRPLQKMSGKTICCLLSGGDRVRGINQKKGKARLKTELYQTFLRWCLWRSVVIPSKAYIYDRLTVRYKSFHQTFSRT